MEQADAMARAAYCTTESSLLGKPEHSAHPLRKV